MLTGNFHEQGELRGRPRVCLRSRRLGHLHVGCRIERDQTRLARPSEGSPEHGVNALDRAAKGIGIEPLQNLIRSWLAP